MSKKEMDNSSVPHTKGKTNSNIDLIKKTQSLPEEVVINFIKSKGVMIKNKKGKLEIAEKLI
jgi:hypothetical protein